MKRLFGYDPAITTIRTELLAGFTTFLTMSYILAVNPSMFSLLDGMSAGAVFTATALAAIIGSLAMALLAKMPFGLAPGMGLNAFFVYTVCLGMGYSWQFALTAVFIEGLIFIVMTLTNLREAIVNAIPTTLRNAIGAGIGLFIAFIGLQNAGIIANNDATLVSLGDITSGNVLLALIGLIITGVLVVKNVRGGMLIGILATTVIGIPMGITDYNGVVSMPHSISDIFCKFEWSNVFTLDMVVVVFTFLFIDMFDTIGTLVGVCTKVNIIVQMVVSLALSRRLWLTLSQQLLVRASVHRQQQPMLRVPRAWHRVVAQVLQPLLWLSASLYRCSSRPSSWQSLRRQLRPCW